MLSLSVYGDKAVLLLVISLLLQSGVPLAVFLERLCSNIINIVFTCIHDNKAVVLSDHIPPIGRPAGRLLRKTVLTLPILFLGVLAKKAVVLPDHIPPIGRPAGRLLRKTLSNIPYIVFAGVYNNKAVVLPDHIPPIGRPAGRLLKKTPF